MSELSGDLRSQQPQRMMSMDVEDQNGGVVKKKKLSKQEVKDHSLDLEVYISNYTGTTKILRLEFIAEVCPGLAVEALKLAIMETQKNTWNTAKYSSLVNALNDVLVARGTGQDLFIIDQQWVENTNRLSRTQSDKLEAELKQYKQNLIKESIRMGYSDLGDYYSTVGDLVSALKSYSRMRDYCSTSKNVIDMCFNIIRVSLDMGNFSHILSYVQKAETTADVPDKAAVLGKLKCCSGLVNLDGARFKAAARNFLDVPFEIANNFSEVISANDVAIYGALCALATFDRGELKRRVFENSEFKQFLELEPTMREIVYSFHSCKYGVCLDLLNKMKHDLLLDIRLSQHVDEIFSSIRQKALVQYFSPFQSVDMRKMAQAFNSNVTDLESELAKLIVGNHLAARIDSHNKILRAKLVDTRSNLFAKAIQMGAEYRTESWMVLLRAQLVQQDLLVTAEQQSQVHAH